MSLGDGEPPPSAGLAPRIIATVIDSLVQLALMVPIAATILIVSLSDVEPGPGPLGPNTPVGVLVAIVVAPFVLVGYHAWLEGRYAQTIGKRLVGLTVVDARGHPLHWRAAILRNVLRLVDFAPVAYAVGGVATWLDDDNRRLGDFVAGTRVVERTDVRVTGGYEGVTVGQD
jgi:uncharacterized RDD family membrane protein YckC